MRVLVKGGIRSRRRQRRHTSLGEESAETLIGILSLALLGEVSIGLEVDIVSIFGVVVVLSTKRDMYLDTVLEAVKLADGCQYARRPNQASENIPPSRSWRSGNQPDRL